MTDARAVESDWKVTALVGDGRMVVEGDSDRLRQVVADLLGNVRSHTETGTPATVSVDRDDGWW